MTKISCFIDHAFARFGFGFLFLFLFSSYSMPCFADLKFSRINPDQQSGYKIQITSDELILESVQEKDSDAIVDLFSNPRVMSSYDRGRIPNSNSILWMVKKIWISKWEKSQSSAFGVFHKLNPQRLIGIVNLASTDIAGQAELTYLFFPEYWGKSYATQATRLLLKEFVPFLLESGTPFNSPMLFEDASKNSRGGQTPKNSELLSEIVARVDSHNQASLKLLDRLGFVAARPELQFLETPSGNVLKDGPIFNTRDSHGKIRTALRSSSGTEFLLKYPVRLKSKL